MGLFFDQGNIKQRLEEMTARDHTNMRNWTNRRKKRYDRIMNEPILPRFCTICFICMLVAASTMTVFDIYAHLTYLSHLGTVHMLQNAVTSAFFGWLVFAVAVIPATAIQLHRGFDDPYYERFLLTKRGRKRMPIRKRFQMYLYIASIGLTLLFVCYLLVRIFM